MRVQFAKTTGKIATLDGPGGIALSVIVVSYNASDHLQHCLHSVFAQSVRVPFEVIVVDNSSLDDSRDMVRRCFPVARLITNATNRLFAPAANQGAASARGTQLLFVNSDIFFPPQTLAALIAPARHYCPVVVPQLRGEDGAIQTEYTFRRIPSFIELASGLLFLDHVSRRLGRPRRVVLPSGTDECVIVEQPSAACLLIERQLFASLGGFDESLALWFNDVDLAKRLKIAGIAIHCRRAIDVLHAGGTSIRRLSSVDRARFLYADTLAYARKWHRSWLHVLRALVIVNLLVRMASDVRHPRQIKNWLSAVPGVLRSIAR